jgi:hypothetical protein
MSSATSHADISSEAWLRAAFERTKLPRNGFADYLELDYASLSRTLTGHRHLNPSELALARGYFSIIPDGLPDNYLQAIEQLRSAKVRQFAATELLRCLSIEGKKDQFAASFARLIEDRAINQTLRADQIVVICRVAELDIRLLLAGHGITLSRWMGTNRQATAKDALTAINVASLEWARPENLHPYEFDRGRRSRPAGSRKTQSAGVTRVLPVQSPTREFRDCTALAVLESKKLPFVPAREVYLAPVDTEIRNGDLIAVLGVDSDAALFGTLSLSTRDKIVLELADGKLEDIRIGEGVKIRRVAFCRT